MYGTVIYCEFKEKQEEGNQKVSKETRHHVKVKEKRSGDGDYAELAWAKGLQGSFQLAGYSEQPQSHS